MLVARYPKKSCPANPAFDVYETSPEFRLDVPREPWSGAFEMEKLTIGSPPLAQISRRFVAVACGTDWETLEQTAGAARPDAEVDGLHRADLVGYRPLPLPGETPR